MDPLYAKLALASRTASPDDILFETTFTSVNGEKQQNYTFAIEATASGGHKAQKYVIVTLGCFEETTVTPSIITETNAGGVLVAMGTNFIPTGTNIKVVMQPDPEVLSLERRLAPSPYFQTYTGNDFITWATDVGDCGVSLLKLCDDAACTNLTDSEVTMTPANPHPMDEDGLLNPVIKLDKRLPLAIEAYIVGYNSDASVSGSVKATFVICGLEEFAKNVTHPIFNVSVTQENVNTTEWLEFNLSTAFGF